MPSFAEIQHGLFHLILKISKEMINYISTFYRKVAKLSRKYSLFLQVMYIESGRTGIRTQAPRFYHIIQVPTSPHQLRPHYNLRKINYSNHYSNQMAQFIPASVGSVLSLT
jgi:hypothetical protein